jgi:hypothetical protein
LCLLATGIVIGLPIPARASFLDIIWEMSGPQMLGYGLVLCRVPIVGGQTSCQVTEKRVGPGSPTISERRVWLNLEGAVYVSLWKDQGETDYRFGRYYMASFEPAIEFASKRSGNVRLFHGAGLASHFLAGPDFRRFTNAGFKVRPIAFEFGNRFELAYNERYYPNGFGADQFGFDVVVPEDREFERSWGVTFTWKR